MKVKRFLLTNWEDFYPSAGFGDSVATSNSLEKITEYVLYSVLLAKKKFGEDCNELNYLIVHDLKEGSEYDLDILEYIVGTYTEKEKLEGYTLQKAEFFYKLLNKYYEQLDENNLKSSFDYFDNEGMIDFDKDDIKEFIELFFELDDEHNSMQDIIDLD